MNPLPSEVIETLSGHPDGFLLKTQFEDGHGLASVKFHKPHEIPQVTLYVSMDDYIDNYGETAVNTGLHYGVEAYDLLSSVPGYNAFGVFVWLKKTAEFATYDEDHCVLRSFPAVTWPEILRTPEQYINGSWYPDRVENKLIRPWSDPAFEGIVGVEDPWS